jgi:hypothetical protein
MATKQEKNRIKEIFSSIVKGVDDRVDEIIGLSINKGIAFSRKVNAKDDTEQEAYHALEDKYVSEIKDLKYSIKVLLADFAKDNF